MSNQVDASEVVQELVQRVSELELDNAMLRVQLKHAYQSKEKEDDQ